MGQLLPGALRLWSPTRAFLAAGCVVIALALGIGQATGQAGDDHGDTFADATPVVLGSSTPGVIRPGMDTDVFVVDLTAATGPVDLWAYTTGELDTVGGLYDSDGALVALNDDSYITDRPGSFGLRSVVEPGVYYVVVVSFEAEPGDYTLVVRAVADPGDSTETAGPLLADVPNGGTLDTEDGADYFRMEFDERVHLIIDTRTLNGAPLVAELLDAEGEPIRANTFSLTNPVLRQLHGLRIQEDFDPGTYYLRVSSARPEERPVPYTIAPRADEEYIALLARCAAEDAALGDPEIDDPLYACQWHLEDAGGEDINARGAWERGHYGEGVHVAVVDLSMDFFHEDLRDNIDPTRNVDYTGSDSIYDPLAHHGTHVAGIVAARDNDIGVRGVAPRATIYGHNALQVPSAVVIADAMVQNGSVTAVSNNSWGTTEALGLGFADTFWEGAVRQGVTVGYGGKGTLYVFSAGNGHLLGADSNSDEYVNYYAVTAVCAVDRNGRRPGYAERGANLWVCAPSGDRPRYLGEESGILTTENADRYVQDFAGTSASAPIVSGVAALLRGAYPDLSWRDVKLILAASARQNDPTNAGWEVGAPTYGSSSDAERYHFNHEYGFGVVDAAAALDLAQGWTTVPTLRETTVASEELDLPVPDALPATGRTTVAHAITVDSPVAFTEFIEVQVTFDHPSFRDLEIDLLSPSGAISRLALPFDTYNDFYNLFVDFVPLEGTYRLGSSRHLGEDPNGVWTLEITDHVAGQQGTFQSWQMTVYGHSSLPVFTAGAGDRSVPENSLPGTSVGAPIEAIGVGEEPAYTLSGPDASDFAIDPATGQITVGADAALDHEERDRYIVGVTAADAATGDRATLAVTIHVTDISLGAVGDAFDANHDELIDRSEVVNAVHAYFAGSISQEDVLAVINLYLEGPD